MSYLPKLKPTVGGGLGGFPVRIGGEYSIGDIQYTEDTLDYKWLPADGATALQTKYEQLFALVGIQNPYTPITEEYTTPAQTRGQAVEWSALGKYVATNEQGTPSFSVLKSNGAGTLVATSVTPPPAFSTIEGFTWSSDDSRLIAASGTSPYLHSYTRTGTSDSLVETTTPFNINPTAVCLSVTFTPDEDYLVVGQQQVPYLLSYSRSGDLYTKLSDPVDQPTTYAWDMKFSPDGEILSLALNVSPHVAFYSYTTGVLSKLTDPSTLPTGKGDAVAWSPDSTYVAIAHETAPYLTVYKRSGTTFTKLPDPVITAPFGGSGVAWNGTQLTVCGRGGPTLIYYNLVNDILEEGGPVTHVPPSVNSLIDLSYSPDGRQVAFASNLTPYFFAYYSTDYYDVETEFQLPDVQSVLTAQVKVL